MKLNEILNEFPTDGNMLLEMSAEDLRSAEKVLSPYFEEIMDMGFTFKQHVYDRTAPGAREDSITKEEMVTTLIKLISDSKRVGKIRGRRSRGIEYNALVTDRSNNLNITFAIDYTSNPRHKNTFKVTTVMRKKNFIHDRNRDVDRFYV